MPSAPANMQGLPSDIEGLRALLLTTVAERDAALSERDALQVDRGQCTVESDN